MLLALDAWLDEARQVVVVWPAGGDPRPLLEVTRKAFLPAHALTGGEGGEPLRALARVTPLVEGKGLAEGRPTAYVCAGGACRLPVTTPAELRAQLAPAAPYR
jgi:hypothetical protein